MNPAAAAPAEGPVLEIKSIAFDRPQIDLTQDAAVVYLEWTITNRSAKATRINGAVELRQFVGGEQVGQPRTVSYELDWSQAEIGGVGTAQESTYRYGFWAPRYASAAETQWRVTKVTIADDVAHARTVRDPGAALAVTQLVDTEGPVAQQIDFASDQPRGFYDDGGGVTLRYVAHIADQSALRKGKLTLAGPGGQRLTTTFQLTQSGSEWSCNGETTYDPTSVSCPVSIAVPGGSPSGTWQIARLDLTDIWGNTRADTAPAGPGPIQVSRNDGVNASNFALAEAQVNNWREQASTALTFTPLRVVGGLTSVDVDLTHCSQPSHTPTLGADGVASVEILVPSWVSSCKIDGVKLTDGAGNVAFYGTAYGAPDLGLTITRALDEKAPVVRSAKLPKATWTSRETGDALGVDVTVEVDGFSPVSQFSTAIYDSTGAERGGSFGGGSEDGAGAIHLDVSTNPLPPGQYTIGFTLTDEAGNTSAWGHPDGTGTSIPGGPLVFTVVSD
jgi:hypothetical protein